MPRRGRPPQPKPGELCKCNCGKPALNDGMFCSDHELLWMAHANRNSYNLQFKHRKLWKQFIRNYRIGPNLYQRIARDFFNISQETVDVQSAALRESSASLKRDPAGNHEGAPEAEAFRRSGSSGV